MYVWSDDSSPFPVLLISEGAHCEVSAGLRATPSVASQQKSASQSLTFMSQEYGFKLRFSLRFGELAGRACEVIGIRETCRGSTSPPRDGEGLSGGLIAYLEEEIWPSRYPGRSRRP